MGKVLIVDDEPDIVKIFAIILNSENIETVTVTNGQDAINAVKDSSISAVILDYFLPDMSGFDVSQKIRAVKGRESLPIIFVSANDAKLAEIPDMENTEKHLKPISNEKLINAVKKFAK